jgi:hypothetical protein
MKSRHLVSLCVFLNVPVTVLGQHPGGGASAPRAVTAPREAAQFDFLVGQWELTVRPKISGLAARIHGAPRLAGTWKAWRAFDGWGIQDELRILDASGNPTSLTHAMRFYDANAKQWTQTQLDVYRGRFISAAGTWSGNQLTLTSRGTDQEGRAIVSRIRFYDITETSFRFRQDRSLDDGKSWDEGTVHIEARRVAAVAPR